MRWQKTVSSIIHGSFAITSLALFLLAMPRPASAQELLVTSSDSDQVLRYNGETGTFIDVFASGGGMDLPLGMICHTDGNLYIAGYHSDQVHRFDGLTGEFINIFASGGGLAESEDAIFGPDGHFYVASFDNNRVLRYNGTTGAFMDIFASGGGLDGPAGMAFGDDGLLYVASYRGDQVLRYDGTSGEFVDVFFGGAALDGPEGVIFGPDGHLYVASFNNDQVLRFNISTGAMTDVFASGGGMDGPVGMVWGPDGNFYVASWNSNQVLRYNGSTGAFIDVFASGGGMSEPAYPAFCYTSGTPINPGLNDAWVTDKAPFQGFFFTAFPDAGFLFVSQFTFDSVPPGGVNSATFGAFDQRWVTGAGAFTGSSVTVNVELTSGGVFNGSVPMASQQQGYGTFEILFRACNSATLAHNFPGPGLSGTLNLKRVLPSNVPLCVALQNLVE